MPRGMATTTAIYHAIDRAVLHPLPYPDPDRIVYLGWKWAKGGYATALSPRKFTFWNEHSRVFAAVGTSRVFDAGAMVTWTSMSWTASAPAGTTIALQYRTGNSPVPDATWTAWTSVAASGAAIAGSSRYAQFVVKETTTATAQTPARTPRTGATASIARRGSARLSGADRRELGPGRGRRHGARRA